VVGRTTGRVDAVATQLEAGQAPSGLGLAPDGGVVQVVDGAGDVLGPAVVPPLLIFRSADPAAGVVGERVALPLAGSAPVALDVRYRTVDVDGRRLTVLAASPLTDVERSIDTLSRTLLIAFPFVVAAVAALAWFLVGRALRPVEAIRAEVESISAATIHRRVPEGRTGDEIARLAHTMNAMLDRLEAAADRQRRFVADASHELRTPLAAIRTELEVAVATPDATRWEEVAAVVLTEEGRLEAVVRDLLDLARADEGTTDADEPVDLAALAADVAGRPWRCPVTVDAVPAVVRGDRAALSAALVHLVDNAARHARSSVQVTVSRRDDAAVITVDDDGDGVAPEDREVVFERFRRLDQGRARDAGGAGLGLAVVRSVVERHGGTATMASSPEGGARVEVVLAGVESALGFPGSILLRDEPQVR
jgi:signal transduction histidine kinase